MAWRWRRSLGRGPFRISLSKKGIGWSVGIPGLRYGHTATGKKYVSQGIPGTAFYRIKYFGGGNNQPQPGQAPPPPGFPSPGPQAPAPQPAPAQKGAPHPAYGPAPKPVMPAVVKTTGGFLGAITRFFDRLF